MKKIKEMFTTAHSRNGAYSVGMTAVVIAIVIVLNMIVSQLPDNLRSIDVSDSKIYEITKTSREILKNLEKKVKLTMLSEETQADKRIRTFINKYANLSDEIEVEWVDPVLHPSVLSENDAGADTVIVSCEETGKEVSLFDLATASMVNNEIALEVTYSHSSPVSPPPFMAACAEVEVDPETGAIELLDYTACVDCGTVVNTNLARVQTEGGLLQGIGMTLYEDVWYNEKGVNLSNSLMQYKIPTRLDFDKIRVEFESSYEPTGPFGAKSIGEIVINTPAPAIAQAVYNATGVWVNELPITPEKILKGMHVI